MPALANPKLKRFLYLRKPGAINEQESLLEYLYGVERHEIWDREQKCVVSPEEYKRLCQ